MWALILSLSVGGTSYGTGISVSSTNFDTPALCAQAGLEAQRVFRYQNTTVMFLCVKTKEVK